jgi:hypothetical protein
MVMSRKFRNYSGFCFPKRNAPKKCPIDPDIDSPAVEACCRAKAISWSGNRDRFIEKILLA